MEPMDIAPSSIPSTSSPCFTSQPSTSTSHSNNASSTSNTSTSCHMNCRSSKTLTTMWSFLPDFHDVMIVTDDGLRIPAHKIILSSSLHYFQSMFLGPMTVVGIGDGASSSGVGAAPTATRPSYVESSASEIFLHDIDGRSLEQIVRWCYFGSVVVNESNVQSLLTTSKMLSAIEVETICVDFILKNITVENSIGIFEFSDVINCHELRKIALDYIHRHFVKIIESDEFLRSMSFERLAEVISSDNLDTGNRGEEVVLHAIVKWYDFDRLNRRSYLPQLLRHVRFPRIRRDVLLSLEDLYPSIADDIEYKNLLIEAFKYHLCRDHTTRAQSLVTIPSTNDSSNERFKSRCPGRPKVLAVIGGQAPKAIKQCECFDFITNDWYELNTELPTRRCRAGVVVLDGVVYAVGGFNGIQRVRTVDCYDPATNRWSQCPPMDARRSTLGVGLLDRKIFAVGGFDGMIGLQSAEYFDPDTGLWKLIATMSTRRSSVGVTTLNEYLYAIGGYDGGSRQCLSSVEFYDPVADVWTLVPDMSMRRSGAAVGVLDNRLIVCGGHDGPAVRKSVECFDPNTRTWIQLSDMIVARRNAGVVSKDGLLYVIGGDDSQANLSSVEVFDPRNNSWSLLPKCMSIGRSYAGVCIIDKF